MRGPLRALATRALRDGAAFPVLPTPRRRRARQQWVPESVREAPGEHGSDLVLPEASVGADGGETPVLVPAPACDPGPAGRLAGAPCQGTL